MPMLHIVRDFYLGTPGVSSQFAPPMHWAYSTYIALVFGTQITKLKGCKEAIETNGITLLAFQCLFLCCQLLPCFPLPLDLSRSTQHWCNILCEPGTVGKSAKRFAANIGNGAMSPAGRVCEQYILERV